MPTSGEQDVFLKATFKHAAHAVRAAEHSVATQAVMVDGGTPRQVDAVKNDKKAIREHLNRIAYWSDDGKLIK